MKKSLLIGAILFFVANPGKSQNNISGYIVSLDTAKPIPNATIILNNEYNLLLDDTELFRTNSDSTGFYTIDGIKAGTYIINAWTTYHALEQEYAMLIISNRVEIDKNLEVDFVFSENAFKYKLDYKFRMEEAVKARKEFGAIFRALRKERSSDAVARRVIHPRIYIDSKRAPILTWYIEKIGLVGDN